MRSMRALQLKQRSRLRRSLGCIMGGLMVAAPIAIFTAPWAWDWHPHRSVAIAMIAVGVFGAMVLYDELREILGRDRR
jgi:hypothetical protein